ncbi:MAG: hypothetical protein E7626_02575 [Ruminococcaceae bacterium]|nr:hypothetical protein [Oscillospiraceae bacterium]
MTNLLNKLRESKTEAVKRIGALAVVGALLVGGLIGCTNNTTNNPNDPTIGGTESSEGTEETGKYSNLLMSVINDEYYNSLMSSTKVEDYYIPAFDAHPYAFLEDQGIDVNKILDGTYKAETMTFVYDDEPNNLYINTRVLVDDSYWHSFLITYALTDKEMADYKLVHGDKTEYSYSWPAFFMNDKISETKQPTNVLSTQYTKKTHEVFDKKASSGINNARDYVLPSIDMSSGTYVYLQYPKHYHNDIPTENKDIWTATFKYNYTENFDGIYEIAENFSQAGVLEKETKQATTFDLSSATIFRGTDLENLDT